MLADTETGPTCTKKAPTFEKNKKLKIVKIKYCVFVLRIFYIFTSKYTTSVPLRKMKNTPVHAYDKPESTYTYIRVEARYSSVVIPASSLPSFLFVVTIHTTSGVYM